MLAGFFDRGGTRRQVDRTHSPPHSSARLVRVTLDLKPRFKVYDNAMLTIGRLADAVGLEAKTLRYYDRVGLLSPTPRTPAGYRLYDDAALQRLQFIRRAKALGIFLADIRRILAVRDEGAAPCSHVLQLVTRNLARVESQIAQLKDLSSDLRKVLRQLRQHIPPDARAAEDCPCFQIIAAFQKREGGASGGRGD